FQLIIKDSKDYHPYIDYIYDVTKNYLLRRGKKLASSIALITYSGYQGDTADDMLQVCCGLEFFRHAILVHDDIVDLEKTRRGGKTLHNILGTKYNSQFGYSASIFIGNILFSIALSTIMKTNFESNKLLKVSELITHNFQNINESQILDLLFEYDSPTVNEWETMARKRAASLFQATILTGAILADAPPEDISLLSDAAINIGYAFDIQDDIIDTFSSQESYGRPPCGDISKGKKPLHIILTVGRNEKADQLIRDLRGKNLTSNDIEQIRQLIRETGALEEAKKIAVNYSQKAKNYVEKTKMDNKTKLFFFNLIDYINNSLRWYT
ncbi:MAG: polyprenyl synthetase family protein, partial [Candidatus Odinarchaeia archaeon]